MSDSTKAKAGNTLVQHDILFINKQERDIYLPILGNQYDIAFVNSVESVSARSVTSQKAIVYDVTGSKYFLKRKPEYSIIEPLKSQSAMLQLTLSKHLKYVPAIIQTKSNEPYAQIGNNFYLLTKFIEGDFFTGRFEQSLNCVKALGEMHKISKQYLYSNENFVDSTESTLKFIGYAEKLHFSDIELQQKILTAIKEKVLIYKSQNLGLKSWIHSDFAPFNIVFKDDEVIGVNDFDNASYGNISKDIAECIISHCDINYAGSTSSLATPVRTNIDNSNIEKMFFEYIRSSNFSFEDLTDFPNEMSLLWLKLMVLGLLRGDYALEDIQYILSHADKLYNVGKQLLKQLK